MRLPPRDDGDLESALRAFPLAAYLATRGFLEQKAGEEYVGTCPHCQGEQKLSVNIGRRFWRCFRCEKYEITDWKGIRKQRPVDGAGGVFRLVQWLEGCTPQRAAEIVKQRALAPDLGRLELVGLGRVRERKDRPTGPPPGMIPCPPDLEYAARRGITPEDVARFGLGYCTWGKYARRLIFPVWWSGQIWYWQARATWEEEEHSGELKYIKVLNPARQPRVVSAEDTLFNLEQAAALARTGSRVVICEGPTSAIHVGYEAVASWGKHLAEPQITLLRSVGVRAVDMLWDGPSLKEPEGARRAVLEVLPRLVAFFDVRVVWLPAGDPGDWPRADLAAMRAQARPAVEHMR